MENFSVTVYYILKESLAKISLSGEEGAEEQLLQIWVQREPPSWACTVRPWGRPGGLAEAGN